MKSVVRSFWLLCASLPRERKVLLASVGWMLLVRLLRYRRRNWYKSLPSLPYNTFIINKGLSSLEFPFLFTTSLEFALFRTYGIPSISLVLHKTAEFENNCAKRYDDTDLLIREFNENFWDSPRAKLALGRLNYLHNQYIPGHPQTKKHIPSITNQDLLYTLSVFVLEPTRWINRYGWRRMTAKESQSIYEGWKEIGVRMGIKVLVMLGNSVVICTRKERQNLLECD